jgi:hypothetical protein
MHEHEHEHEQHERRSCAVLEPERIDDDKNTNRFIAHTRVEKGEGTGGDETRGQVG